MLLQFGKSPLLAASAKGYLDIVRTLISAGADLDQPDEVGINCQKSIIIFMLIMG